MDTEIKAPDFLSEDNLSLLESQWSSLPEQAVCESRPGGWVLKMVGDGTVFHNAGFTDDQWIGTDELLTCARTAGDKARVERLLAVFDHIRRPVEQ